MDFWGAPKIKKCPTPLKNHDSFVYKGPTEIRLNAQIMSELIVQFQEYVLGLNRIKTALVIVNSNPFNAVYKTLLKL